MPNLRYSCDVCCQLSPLAAGPGSELTERDFSVLVQIRADLGNADLLTVKSVLGSNEGLGIKGEDLPR